MGQDSGDGNNSFNAKATITDPKLVARIRTLGARLAEEDPETFGQSGQSTDGFNRAALVRHLLKLGIESHAKAHGDGHVFWHRWKRRKADVCDLLGALSDGVLDRSDLEHLADHQWHHCPRVPQLAERMVDRAHVISRQGGTVDWVAVLLEVAEDWYDVTERPDGTVEFRPP
jgi:hypothetical protein